MLSRSANSIYWMTRYIERAENIARIIDVNLHLNLDLPSNFDLQWKPLVWITGESKWFEEHYDLPSEENVMKFLTFDSEYQNSIVMCLKNARENARSVREMIPSDLWEQINRLYLFVNEEVKDGKFLDSPYDFFGRIRMSCHLFTGILVTTMSRDEAWHFARTGLLIERADKTSRILDIKYFMLLPTDQDINTPFDNIQWAALLKSAGALEMYRKKVKRIDHREVAKFLLLDREFPRSIQFCLNEAQQSLHKISNTPLENYSNPAEQVLGRLRSAFDYQSIDDIIKAGLHEFIDHTQLELNSIGTEINNTFFSL